MGRVLSTKIRSVRRPGSIDKYSLIISGDIILKSANTGWSVKIVEVPKDSFERIKIELERNSIVLFMKGDRNAPQCGFSAKVVSILNTLTEGYHTVNVLEDSELRNSIKEFSDWPTIPQLYVNKKFVGGCDLVESVYESGELEKLMEADKPKANFIPDIRVSDDAVESMKAALLGNEHMAVHLVIDDGFNHDFRLAPVEPGKVKAVSNGVEIYLDESSARRASGLEIDMIDSTDGRGFKIFNPNVNSKPKDMSVEALKILIESDEKFYLIDVRTLEERQIANIEGSRMLDESLIELINETGRNSRLVFFCHSGVRSQEAVRYFFDQGYTDVTNLTGGIDAWSTNIDSSVPRY